MKFRDYYETLGVEREASQDEIKRAYRRLARKYHPDVSTESAAEERFKEMKEAYEVLKDPEKREAYDKFGENWQAGQDFEPPPTWEQDFAFEGGGFTDAHEFSDFFESLFGQRHGHRYRSASPHQEQYRSVRMAGEDIQARMSINVEDAFRGATKTINIEIPVIQGNGRPSSERRTLNVRIPKGITEGKRIRLEGQGGPGIGGGLAGDLYVEISFDPHRFYTVQARDVFVTLPITAWEAALGSKVTAPTLGGPVDLTIPAGITSQRKLRLKGRGFPGQPAGDQIVDVQIVVPNKMSQEVRELYEQLQKKEHFHPRQILGV